MMDKKSRKPSYSIDGFVPSNRGPRQVGLGAGGNLNGQPLHKVPSRRPSFRSQLDSHEPRKNLVDFSVRAQQTTASGGEQANPLQHHTRRERQPHEQNTEEKTTRKSRRGISWKKVIKRTSLVCALFIVLCGGWLGWKLMHDSSKVFGSGSNLLGFLSATKLKGEDQGRVNILLAGVSTDDPGHQGANLTDSIMLVSLDTKNNKASLISIPRDLWVSIPGDGHNKINAANSFGDDESFNEAGYPTGGIGLLEQILSDDLDIKVNYYAKIDYTAFRDAVNAVGGIQVNIQSKDPRGLYDPNIAKADGGPLRLANGSQTLDGQTALNLARARGDSYYSYGFPGSDFDRTEHQRQMLIALKSKAASTSVLANPIKLGQLFDALGKNVQTDFKTSEIRRLYDLSKQISANNMQSISLNNANGTNLLSNYQTPNGQSALIPAAGPDDFSQIQLFLKKLMSSNPLVRESANVVVLNGGNISGLAGKEKKVLTDKGFNVVSVGDAPAASTTTIVDLSDGKMPATKQALQGIFGTNVTTANPYGYPSADFIVVLGANQKDPSASTPAAQN